MEASYHIGLPKSCRPHNWFQTFSNFKDFLVIRQGVTSILCTHHGRSMHKPISLIVVYNRGPEQGNKVLAGQANMTRVRRFFPLVGSCVSYCAIPLCYCIAWSEEYRKRTSVKCSSITSQGSSPPSTLDR